MRLFINPKMGTFTKTELNFQFWNFNTKFILQNMTRMLILFNETRL
jgi:hypothetical protein